MRIFITGATGGLGSKLVPLLGAKGHELTLLSLDVPVPFSQKNAHVIVGDLLATDTYRDALKNIDAIIHLAAVTHTNEKKLYYKVNTEGTKALVDLAKQYAVKRFIFVSTRAIAKGGGAYSDSKRLAEEIVQNSGLDWTIVRPAEVYGVTEGEAITKLIKNIASMPFVPIIGNGNYKIAPVHIDDVLQALAKIVEQNNTIGKVYTLAGPEEYTYTEFVGKVMGKKGIKKVTTSVPIMLLKILAFIFSLIRLKKPPLVRDQIPRLIISKDADISLARKDLDFDPQNILGLIK